MTIPLKTIVAQVDRRGCATTIIYITVAQLFGEDKERLILSHAKAKPRPSQG